VIVQVRSITSVVHSRPGSVVGEDFAVGGLVRVLKGQSPASSGVCVYSRCFLSHGLLVAWTSWLLCAP
jgi:hypothetical protein